MPRAPREPDPSLAHALARWDDPLTWSVPVATFAGSRLAIHGLMAVWCLAELALSMSFRRIGAPFILTALGSLIAVVVVREAARLAVGRRLGVDEGYVPLWPGGALLIPAPPRRTPHALLYLASAWAANALIAAGLAAALLAAGAPASSLNFDPFNPTASLIQLSSGTQVYLWWAYLSAVAVLAVNLVPALPLDAGRLVEWSVEQRNPHASRRAIAVLSLLVGVGIIVLAALVESPRLIPVGLVCLLTGSIELRRDDFSRSIPTALTPPESSDHHDVPFDDPFDDEGTAPGAVTGGPAHDTRVERGRPRGVSSRGAPEPRAHTPPRDDDDDAGHPGHADPAPEARLDAILAKISREGIASLTDEERTILDAESRRRRER
ncbi:MAG: hypothetical protein HRU70_08475 [Phycisphaeraceae bacterium]|nr:MAG: hypothetical protein HRU70_08475 [Phycisphaeraceae bacterium]